MIAFVIFKIILLLFKQNVYISILTNTVCIETVRSQISTKTNIQLCPQRRDYKSLAS